MQSFFFDLHIYIQAGPRVSQWSDAINIPLVVEENFEIRKIQ
jgi:hypothetical protein